MIEELKETKIILSSQKISASKLSTTRQNENVISEKIRFESRFEQTDIKEVSFDQKESCSRESVCSSNMSENLAHEVESVQQSIANDDGIKSQNEEMEVVMEEQNESNSENNKTNG